MNSTNMRRIFIIFFTVLFNVLRQREGNPYTAVIFNVAAIANNNLQDLKTGQLVDATPWKQQVALIIGVIAGAFVIPPVLVAAAILP